MKPTIYFILGLLSIVANAQSAEHTKVKQAVDEFFDAFHEQDSIKMKKLVHPSIYLQTIGFSKEGKPNLHTENFEDLIRSINSIPDSTKFEERLTDYIIKIDGNMANAWTTYEFWLNDKFHHCGVNSFQFFREEDSWKIIYLIDTRRQDDCKPLSE